MWFKEKKGGKRAFQRQRGEYSVLICELGLEERQIILKPAVSWMGATIVTLIPTIFFVMSGNKEKLLSWIQKMLIILLLNPLPQTQVS